MKRDYSGLLTMPKDPDQYAWLDKYIAEQAAYYGLTIDQFTKAMDDLAEAQYIMEATT